MKQYGKNCALIICLLAGQLFSANSSTPGTPEKDFDPARGIALRYNQPIIINNQGRTLWVHTMSRLRGSTDETRYNPEKPYLNIPANTSSPNDHFEVLVTEFNADNRLKNGACLFSLQKIEDPSSTSAVKSGDTVRIIALYGAAGYKEKEGILPGGRILHVENSSRLGDHDLTKELSHFDTFVSDPKFPGTQDDGGKFILQGPQSGTLYSKDLIIIQNKEYKRPLCAFIEGRWGNKFGELVAVRGLDAKDPATLFNINFVDIDMLSETGQKNLQGILSAGIQTKLFTLRPENSPGNSPFRFNPSLHGGRLHPQFSDATWQLANASDGYVIFDVTPNGGSIKIVFSPAKKITPDTYVLVIGDEKNSSTRLSKNEKVIFTAEGAKNSNAIFPDLSKSSSFWFKISGKILTAGSGRELGKNEFLHFEETDPEAGLVSFVGFAGSEGALFENISINAKEIKTSTSVGSTGAGTSSSTIAMPPKTAESSSIKTIEAKTGTTAKSSSIGPSTRKYSEPVKAKHSDTKSTAQTSKQGDHKSKRSHKHEITGTSKDKKSTLHTSPTEQHGKKKDGGINTKESTSSREKSTSQDKSQKSQKRSQAQEKSRFSGKNDTDAHEDESKDHEPHNKRLGTDAKEKVALPKSKSGEPAQNRKKFSSSSKQSDEEKDYSSSEGHAKSLSHSSEGHHSGKGKDGYSDHPDDGDAILGNKSKDDREEKRKSDSSQVFAHRLKNNHSATTDD